MATILTKKKDTTGAPVAGDLTNSAGGAELAVNTADKRLYTKDSGGNVVEVGTNPGTAVTFTAGTVSAPAITTTGDVNTGIFFPAADTIAFAEGGAEAMRIDSNGVVGIGVVPSGWSSSYKTLQIRNGSLLGDGNDIYFGANLYFDGANNRYIGTGFASQYIQISGEHVWRTAPSGTAGNTLSVTEVMRIDSSGNVGIGTSSPSSYDADFRNIVIASAASAGISIISGTANNGTLAFGDGTGAANYRGYVQYNHTNDALIFASAASERMRIDSSGNVTLQKNISVGGATPTTSGTGITFPATQSASSDANTLDDYEEGTWTPRIDGTTSAGTGTYSVQVGAYTKVGNLVTITGYLNWSNHTGTGGIAIANFPFASKNTANLYQAVTYGYVDNITLSANTVVASYIAPNSSVTAVFQYPSGGGATAAVAMDTSGEFIFTATYIT